MWNGNSFFLQNKYKNIIMKHIKLFEAWSYLKESNKKSVIDFNKLPVVVKKSESDGTINRNDDKVLWDAGFPKVEDKMERSGFKSPFTDINFLRYYNDIGGEYRKKAKEPTPNYITKEPKYDPGFLGKFECITKQNPQKYIPIANKDGIINMFTTQISAGTIKYYPNGKSKVILHGSESVGPEAKNAKWIDSTWRCSNGKLIDSFIRNDYKMKPYKGDPFIGGTDPKTSYIPIGTTDDGSDGKYITDLQNRLIELNYLNIPKATGNYGNMTHRAVVTASKGGLMGDVTKGVTRHFYDLIMKGLKINDKTFKFT